MKSKILVFGGSGLVGSKFIDLNSQIFDIKAPGTSDVDILNKDQIAKAVEDFNPDSIVNFAAYTQVEEAEEQKGNKEGICFQVNAIGAKNIAEVTKSFNKHLVHISTEYVFAGTKDDSPYVEEDSLHPINWYGQSKFVGEQFVLESGCRALVVRISMPFSSYYKFKTDIARFFLEQLRTGGQIKAVEDQRITPTLVNDIAYALRALLDNQTLGVYHISSKSPVTPLEFAQTLAEIFNLNYSLISSTTLAEFNKNKKAKLLKYSWLNPAKFEREFGDQILHIVEEGLIIFKQEIDRRS